MRKANYGQYEIECYLDWFNNYLTLTTFAEHHNMSANTAYDLINRGRKLHNESVAAQGVM